jgi:hypothetical protein
MKSASLLFAFVLVVALVGNARRGPTHADAQSTQKQRQLTVEHDVRHDVSKPLASFSSLAEEDETKGDAGPHSLSPEGDEEKEQQTQRPTPTPTPQMTPVTDASAAV